MDFQNTQVLFSILLKRFWILSLFSIFHLFEGEEFLWSLPAFHRRRLKGCTAPGHRWQPTAAGEKELVASRATGCAERVETYEVETVQFSWPVGERVKRRKLSLVVIPVTISFITALSPWIAWLTVLGVRVCDLMPELVRHLKREFTKRESPFFSLISSGWEILIRCGIFLKEEGLWGCDA